MNGQAVAFPAEPHLFLRGQPGWPDETFADPEEPVGRPLHPITSRSMAVGYRTVAPRNLAEPEDRRWRPEVLQLITNPNAGGAHVMQEIYLRLFEKSCLDRPTERTRKNRLVEVSSVLQDCRIGQRDKPDDGDWPSYLVARPGTHPEFAGRRFAVHCTHPYSPGGSRSCEAYYRMEGDLGVMYRFDDTRVPPEHMAEFDLQIRAFIAASRAPEYDSMSEHPRPDDASGGTDGTPR